MSENAAEQQYLEFEQQYLEMMRRQQEAMIEMANAQKEASWLAEQQLEIAKRQAQIAEEQYSYWKETFEPLEREVVAVAKRGIDQDFAGELAASEARAQWLASQDAADRTLQRLGLSQNDPRYEEIKRDMRLVESAVVTGARNTAMQRAREASTNMKLAVAGLGRGIPLSTLQTMTQSAESIAGAATAGLRGSAGVAEAQTYGGLLASRAAQGIDDTSTRYNQFLIEQALKRDTFRTQMMGQMFMDVGRLTGLVAGTAMGQKVGPSEITDAPDKVVTA